MNKDNIIKLLETIIHPAKDKDIVSLGMVEDVDISADKIKFKLIFPGRDPLSESLKKRCEDLIQSNYPDYKVSILEMIREKKQNKALMVEESFEAISGVGKIIAVASGKGGVGKSTVAVNLAVTLAQMGYKVGLADADVYGPSVAKMTDTEGSVPEVIMKDGGSENGGTDLIVPIERYGVKWMSIGYFARPEQALIWRGPMACNALKQMILQVEWGELDFLLLDLPPGTGDIHIALVHDIPLAGAIIVSTPQAVALADVEKGVNLFRNKNVNKPIFGLIENMSWFTPEELPDNKYYIFGKGGGEKMANKYQIPLLGQIPIVQGIMEGGDSGLPAVLTQPQVLEAFENIAHKLGL